MAASFTSADANRASVQTNVVEKLLLIALDSKGWLGYGYTEALQIIQGNKHTAQFRHAKADKGKP